MSRLKFGMRIFSGVACFLTVPALIWAQRGSAIMSGRLDMHKTSIHRVLAGEWPNMSGRMRSEAIRLSERRITSPNDGPVCERIFRTFLPPRTWARPGPPTRARAPTGPCPAFAVGRHGVPIPGSVSYVTSGSRGPASSAHLGGGHRLFAHAAKPSTGGKCCQDISLRHVMSNKVLMLTWTTVLIRFRRAAPASRTAWKDGRSR
jgi:hypothetical protein